MAYQKLQSEGLLPEKAALASTVWDSLLKECCITVTLDGNTIYYLIRIDKDNNVEYSETTKEKYDEIRFDCC